MSHAIIATCKSMVHDNDNASLRKLAMYWQLLYKINTPA